MISNIKATEGVGNGVIKKTIHAGSEAIMFSVLQETQYMYPIKSSVREIVSNSLDSINERDNALKILRGEIKVEDLFIEKEGSEYKESKFDKNYFNEEWLSDKNEVTIHYIENDTELRDRIEFIDHGVGLGGRRLLGYFNLGFSSKRLSKSQLGNFGLGAKSLLATGVDSYKVTSHYNGKMFRFEIFKDHVIPDISKFNDNGETNDLFVFPQSEQEIENNEKPYECYYEKTTSKNKVIIETEVKRHRKQDYISAIENQLGYIDNVKLVISDTLYHIKKQPRNIASEILFKTDKLLVGASDYYARPQILLRPGEESNILINYGPVSWAELEMKEYGGNISFIMNINEVDVTPSRESVIWNAKTRNALKDMFQVAQETVTSLIAEKLVSATCLAEHYNLLNTFKGKGSIDGISELYKIIDKSAISLKFRDFDFIKAIEQLADNNLDRKLSFTGATITNDYYNGKAIGDVEYMVIPEKSNLAGLDPNNSEFEMLSIVISPTRYKNIGKFLHHKRPILDDLYKGVFPIVHINDETYKSIEGEIKKAGGYTEFLDLCYAKERYDKVLFGEVFRAIALGAYVLKAEDIDISKMTELAAVEVEAKQTGYMNAASRAKLENKVQGTLYSSSNYGYRNYYNEDSLERLVRQGNNVIIFPLKNSTIENILDKASSGYFSDSIKLIGFSEDNFKRFKDIAGIETFTNSIYKIDFGDISLTPFGKHLFPNARLNDLRYSARRSSISIKDALDKDLNSKGMSFLTDTFIDVKIDKTMFKNEVEVSTDKVSDKINKEKYKEAALSEPKTLVEYK